MQGRNAGSIVRTAFIGCMALMGSRMCFAQPWDWTYALPAPLADASPAAVSAEDANGFWARGLGLLHYRADGSIDVARNSDRRDSALSAPLSDGGILFADPLHATIGFPEFPEFCHVMAYSATGSSRWRITLPASFSYCQRIGVDAADVAWVKTTAAGAYVLSTSPPGIFSLDQNASIRWTWSDASNSHYLQKLTLGRDGNLYAAGQIASSGNGNLVIASVAPDGTPRFLQTDADVQIAKVNGLLATTDGAVYVLDTIKSSNGLSTSIALQRIGSDGAVQWSHVLSQDSDCGRYLPDCAFAVSAQGDALVALIDAGTLRAYRYDSAGNALFSKQIDAGSVASLTARSNGDALLSVTSDASDSFSFLQIDRSGQFQSAPNTHRVIDHGFDSAQSLLNDDGSSYLLGNGPQGMVLSKIDANGQRVWRNDSDTTIAIGNLIAAGSGLVCALGPASINDGSTNSVLTCFSDSDGSVAWSVSVSNSASGLALPYVKPPCARAALRRKSTPVARLFLSMPTSPTCTFTTTMEPRFTASPCPRNWFLRTTTPCPLSPSTLTDRHC